MNRKNGGKTVTPRYVSGFEDYLKWLDFQDDVGKKGRNKKADAAVLPRRGGDPVTCVGGNGGGSGGGGGS